MSVLLSILSVLFLGAAKADTMNLLMWNPHWECFAQSAACKSAVFGELNSMLPNLDFAGLVELGSDYRPPSGWTKISHKCGVDTVDLIYNSNKWEATGSAAFGCSQNSPPDRPYIVQAFSKGGSMVTAIAAHYPHGFPHNLENSINQVGGSRVVFMADTNNGGSPNSFILSQIGVDNSNTQGSALEPSCCLNDGYHAGPYDRVIANFGTSISSEMLYKDVPAAMRVGKFHKAIRASLQYDGRREVTYLSTWMVQTAVGQGICFMFFGIVVLAVMKVMTQSKANDEAELIL